MGKTTLKIGHLPIIDHLVLGITNHKIRNQLEKNEYADIELQRMFSWNEVGGAFEVGVVGV